MISEGYEMMSFICSDCENGKIREKELVQG